MISDALLADAESPERTFDNLLAAVTETIEYHFSDFALRESGEALDPAASRRMWIESLVSLALDMSPTAWNRNWLESVAIAEGDLSRQHEEVLREWEDRRERAREFKRLLAEESLVEVFPAHILAKLHEDTDKALNAEKPTFDSRSVPPEAAEGLATRGIVYETLRRGLEGAKPTAERTIEVLDLLRLVSRDERVRTFLARCGRCYVAGLYPETVVMACSAIEQQLERIVDDEAVRKILSLGPSDKIMLGRRLIACKKLGVLSSADHKELQSAVNVRNDIIHLAPTVGASKESALSMLALSQRVLVRLEGLARD